MPPFRNYRKSERRRKGMQQRAPLWDVVVIGAGIAGLSTAIWARRLNLTAIVLEAKTTPGGQLLELTFPIPDYPGLPGIQGPDLAQILYRQALDAGAEVRLGTPVLWLEPETHSCTTPTGTFRARRAVVVATGLRPRRLEVPGEAELHQAGLVRRPSQELAWFRGKRVAVVGGGDRAAENAALLASEAADVFLIHRRSQLRARAALAAPLFQLPNIHFRWNTRVTAFAVRPDAADRSAAATLFLTGPGGETQLEVDAVCIYIGNVPNDGLLSAAAASPVDASGCTTAPGIYAVGDVNLPPVHQSLVACAAQAMMAAKAIALQQSPGDEADK